MPNHVINILSFEGDKAKIRQMLEDIKDNECGLPSVDFNKIIPMPPGLDLKAGSCTQAGLDAYRDFIDVYTLGGTINTEHLSDIPVASEQRFLEARTDIRREDFALGKQAWNNLRQYGAATWYDWCCANWGTKWNAYDIAAFDEDSDTITFETAWSAPHPILEKLSQMFPEVCISHYWADEDIGSNCGWAEYEGGEQIRGNDSMNDAEATEFAAQQWDYDIEKDLKMYMNRSRTKYICADNEEYDLI